LKKTGLTYLFIFFAFTLAYAQDFERYELSEIKFEGNNFISSSELKGIISSQESPGWLSQFFYSFSSIGGEAIYFDSLLIKSDKSTLKSYYWARGFFEVKISHSYQHDTEDKEVTLIYSIQEGEPYYFRSLVNLGLDEIYSPFRYVIENESPIDSTLQYSDQLIEESVSFTINFLRDNGYMLIASEGPVINVDTLVNKVDVILKYNTGRRYKIGDINVTRTGEGKDLVEDKLLKDIVNLKQGMYYSFYELRKAQIRLYRTDLFSSALVTAITADTSDDYVSLSISADVGKVHELSPEIIINNEDNTFNVGLTVGFSKKNFLGDARKLTISTSGAVQNISDFVRHPSFADSSIYGYIDGRVAIEQPFLFGYSVNTKLESYITSSKLRGEYTASIYGAKLSFDIELPQYTFLTSLLTYINWENSSYNFDNDYILDALQTYYSQYTTSENPDSSASEIFSQLGSTKSITTNAVLGVELGINKANDFLFPTEGYSLSILLEDGNSIPYMVSRLTGDDFNNPLYYKALISSSIYFPYEDDNNSAVGLKLRSGYIGTYSGDKFDIPLNQRFYAGGSNSVRGWKTRELVPDNTGFILSENPTNEEIQSRLIKGITPGGFFLLEGSIETRNRIIGDLGGVLFLDFGNSWNNYTDFQFDEVAVAAGFGLRYYSNIAPVRLDFGFRAYDPENRKSFFKKVFWNTFEFNIGIGEAF